MNQANALNNVNKFLIGSAIWLVFILFPFYSADSFQQSSFSEHFGLNHSFRIIYAIQLVFFLVLSLNMLLHTIGKKHSVITVKKIMEIMVLVLVVISVTQAISIFFDIGFHFGVINYAFGTHSAFLMNGNNFDVATFLIYLTAQFFMITYIVSMAIYLYQLKKMKFKLTFTYLLRLGVAFLLYAYALGFAFEEFNFYRMFFYSVYILVALIIYVKASFSLKAALIGVFLLIIL